jgi:hypothetical protein
MQRSRLISKIKFEDCKGMKEFKHGLDWLSKGIW